MRPATRASSPRHPDPPANPRSTLPYPTCGRLQKPPTGYQSLTRPATGISRPPIASYLPPHLGSKMTKARTAGITPRNVSRIVAGTAVREVHLSARVSVESRMTHRNSRCYMGGTLRPPEFSWKVTDESVVRDVVERLRQGA